MCHRACKSSATGPKYSAGSPATWDIRLSRSYAIGGICAEISYCVESVVSSNRRMIIETCRSIFVVRLILFTEISRPFKIACHVLLSPPWDGVSDHATLSFHVARATHQKLGCQIYQIIRFRRLNMVGWKWFCLYQTQASPEGTRKLHGHMAKFPCHPPLLY